MVKIFVGNIANGVTSDDMRELFGNHGKVTECDVLGSYGFVHMDDENEAEDAIAKLDKYNFNGSDINVEKSKGGGSRGGGMRGGGRGAMRGGNRGGYGAPFGAGYGAGGGYGSYGNDNSAGAKSARRAGCAKLHVASLPDNCRSTELRHLFERYGRVAECDVVEDRNIAFVHIEEFAAEEAIYGLSGYRLRGSELKVQMSKNQGALGQGDRGGMRGGRGGMRGGPMGGRGRFNEFQGRNFGGPGRMERGGDFGNGESAFEANLPPPAKDRMELLELLDKRRRLENLDPYERRLIACQDLFNLPPPPPEYLRLVRERALVKARLPLPTSASAIGRTLPTAGSATTSSALTRALIARRAAAVAANVKKEQLQPSAGYGGGGVATGGVYGSMYSREY